MRHKNGLHAESDIVFIASVSLLDSSLLEVVARYTNADLRSSLIEERKAKLATPLNWMNFN